MDIKVRFRFNKLTGEIEEFVVDQDSQLGDAEHNREHDRLAAEIGGLLERLPRIEEGAAALGSVAADRSPDHEEPEHETESETPRRERERNAGD